MHHRNSKTLCYEGTLSAIGYFLSIICLLLSFVLANFLYDNIYIGLLVLLVEYALLNLILKSIKRSFHYQIAVRACLLGFVFSVGMIVFVVSPAEWKPFGLYLSILSCFHYSEFLAIAWCNPDTLSIDSFILNHSIEYTLAAVISCIEFMLEAYYLPYLKMMYIVTFSGVLLCTVGEVLRKLAMITASSNFTHTIQNRRVKDHVLVTNGIYSLMRHPSYTGWFMWALGTQVIMVNPICFLLYTLASWKFFHDRIYIEEYTLIQFFGKAYIDYRKKVFSGIPFVAGFGDELASNS